MVCPSTLILDSRVYKIFTFGPDATFFTEENAGLCEHSNQVEAQLTKSKTELQRLQEKHKTLTEYFEQKEHNLHR